MPTLGKIYESVSKVEQYKKVCKSLRRHVKVCKCLWMHDKVCQKIERTYEKVWKKLKKNASPNANANCYRFSVQCYFLYTVQQPVAIFLEVGRGLQVSRRTACYCQKPGVISVQNVNKIFLAKIVYFVNHS